MTSEASLNKLSGERAEHCGRTASDSLQSLCRPQTNLNVLITQLTSPFYQNLSLNSRQVVINFMTILLNKRRTL